MSKLSGGIFWSAIERFSSQGISFLITLILARLVSPESYGLIVLIQVFLSISQVFIDGGFSNALVQKIDRNDKDFSTAFIFNLFIAIVLYFIIYIISPFIAAFYDNDKLILITRVLALNLIFSSICLVHKAKLIIDLDFKTQAKASLISVALSGILGIFLAYNGFEVWALVVQSLLNQVLNSFLLFILTKIHFKLEFCVESFRSLFKFGSKLLVANLITNIFINLYSLIIGKRYSKSDLAFYNRAYSLIQFPSTNIEAIFNRTFYPIECELQNDLNSLKITFYKFLHLSCFVIFPIIIFICVLSRPLVSFLLTDTWLPTAKYLSILGLNFMWFPLVDQLDMLLNVIGKTDLTLKSVTYRRIASLVIMGLTINYNIEIICWGLVISMLTEILISWYFVHKCLDISLISIFKSISDLIITGLFLSLILFGISLLDMSPILILILGFISMFTVFTFFCYIFKMNEVQYLKQLILK